MDANFTEQKLRRMEEELNAAKRVLAAEKSSLQKLRRRKRSYMLLQAGLLFEEAGILYDYDPDVVLALLRELKNGGEDDGRNQGSTRAAR
jgi:hypothetical protein